MKRARVVAAVLLAACSLSALAGTTRPSDYRASLDAFFKEVDATYPFFELKGIKDDWEQCKKRLAANLPQCRTDAQFLGMIQDAIDCLRDAHMAILDAKVKLAAPEPEYCPGISFIAATQERVCVMVPPSDATLASKLPAGTVITQIDGQPARKWLDEQAAALWKKGGCFSSPQRAKLFTYRIPFSGERGKRHAVVYSVGGKTAQTVLTNAVPARGWPHTYAMPAGLQGQGAIQYVKLPSNCGYIYMRAIDEKLCAQFDAALKHIGEAKGLIVDLRGCGGGGYENEIYKRFNKRTGATQGIPFWGGKIVVLLDAGCISAGETFARDLYYYAQAHLMGEMTAGSSSSKKTWPLPNGLASIRISERTRGGIDKAGIEFNGIKPQTLVEVDPDEMRRGINSGIKRAEEFLAKE